MSSRKRTLPITLAAFAALGLTAGCGSHPPIRTEESVDLDRFMGDWYVISHIPTFLEDDAFNAVETYELRPNGTVDTTFRFNRGSFDGPEKVYNPRGFPKEKHGNAVWGMRFFWPFKMEYRVLYVDKAYTRTVIGRAKRDYAWIMAREPVLPEEEYGRLVRLLEEEGYDLSELRRVPQETGTTEDGS